MRTCFLFRVCMALGFCLILTLPATSQSGGYGSIGPSKGEVVGGIVGGAAVLGTVGYIIYHHAHSHPTVTGCLTSDKDGLSLTNEKDKRVYILSGNLAALQAGERVAIKGKKSKDASGKVLFQVESLVKDLGSCQPSGGS